MMKDLLKIEWDLVLKSLCVGVSVSWIHILLFTEVDSVPEICYDKQTTQIHDAIATPTYSDVLTSGILSKTPRRGFGL